MSHHFKSKRRPDADREIRELAGNIRTQEDLDQVLDRVRGGLRNLVFKKIWPYLGNPELVDKLAESA